MAAVYSEFDVDHGQHLPSHRRNGSDDLDVFDAVNYFLGQERFCHASSLRNFTTAPHKNNVRKNCQYSEVLTESSNVDVPLPCRPQLAEKQERKEMGNKRPKTPKSPGMKFSGFLNSLFVPMQGKTKQKPARMSAKACNENPIEIRTNSESLYSSSSGFDTSSSLSSNGERYKELVDVVDDDRNHFQWKNFPANRRSLAPFSAFRVLDDKSCINVAWLEQNFIASDFFSAKKNRCQREKECKREGTKEGRKELSMDASVEREKNDFLESNNSWKSEEVDDDGFESDSSSDLFELEICDLHNCHSTPARNKK